MKTILYLIFSFILIGKIQAQSWETLNAEGEKLYGAGKYAEATAVFEKAKIQAEKEFGKMHKDYAASCSNLATSYQFQGLYTKAEPLYIEGKSIEEKVLGKEHPDYALSCNSLALFYRDQGLYTKAEPFYIEAKNIQEKVLGKEHPEYANSCNNLGGLYASQGLYTKAEPLYIEAKSIREKVSGKEHPEYAVCCNNLGTLYVQQRLYAQAEPLLVESKNTREKVLGKAHPHYAISCNNLAILYHSQGLYIKAIPLYIESKNIKEKFLGKEHPSYANSCNTLAALYYDQGFYTKAEPLFMEAKSIYEKVFGKEHPSYAEICNRLGILYEYQNEFLKANSYYQQAGNVFISQIENNFSNLSENEKGKFLKTFYGNFECYNSFTIKANKQIPNLTMWAYNNSLVTKGLLFSGTQKIKERIQNSNDVVLKQLYDDWRNKKKAYSKALQLSLKEREKQNISTEKLQTEANELEKQLSQKSELFAKANDKTRYTWQDVQKQLKKDEVIVEIIRTQYFDKKQTDSTLYMALIITPKTKNQPEMVVLPNGKELETDAVAYYKNKIKFKKEDKASYNAFWKDIKARLGKAKKVYFVPDGVYHQINLVTLQNPATKAYVRSEIQVQLLSSSKDLIKYTENAKKQRKNFKDYQIHLFGYPNYAQKGEKKPTTKEERSLSFSAKMDTTQRFFNPNSGTITILEGTKTEINNISKILTDKNIKNTNYLENQAEEGTIKTLKSPDILHIATHGFFLGDTENFDKDNANKFRENPLLRSGLLLKDAEKGLRGEILEGEDGVLTAQEAINLNLDDTELVVMSACETGLGEIKNGEGVYGLQRSFQQAGAKTILMSLWKVDDVATQEVMTLFYNNLVAGKTKRQAFDDAQETLYKKYKNPYFWGAFVMVGE